MHSRSILLSGATGFLGSHIAEVLSNNGYNVLVLIRDSSVLWRLDEIQNKNIFRFNINVDGFKNEIEKYSPECFIHSAWQGVDAKNRSDWSFQSKNIVFTIEMLELAEGLGIKKNICFGSQAEYGNFYGRIKEDAICLPNTAYGAAKLSALVSFRSYCESHNINWFWFRLFSLYGTREDDNWLIPSLIKSILKKNPIDLTGCDQRYDYIYTTDFAEALIKVIQSNTESGIFNLTSNSAVRLKDLIEVIKNKLDPNAVLNFGALPYRPGQVMHMEGDSTKFNEKFNVTLNPEFDKNLDEIVNYYNKKYSSHN